jgi:hypothetical protein
MARGIVIRDGTQPGGSGGLEFDLAQVLLALGEPAAQSRWKCSRLHYVSNDDCDIDVLEQASAPNGSVRGADLVNGIQQLAQVIDGDFEATDAAGRQWVLVRAVDSSWWEVWSEDESVLGAVRNTFKFTEATQSAR